jgi:hypothetical protein
MITHISPAGSMDLLSQLEVERLKKNQVSCTSSTVTVRLRSSTLVAIPTTQKSC